MTKKFEYGDIVIGNERAGRYSYTKPGTKWVVLRHLTDSSHPRSSLTVSSPEKIDHWFSIGYTMEDIIDAAWDVDPTAFDLFKRTSTVNRMAAKKVLKRFEE